MSLSRRSFLKSAAAGTLPVMMTAAASTPDTPRHDAVIDNATLRWLDGAAPAISTGTTLGVPWPRGQHRATQAFALTTADGKPVAMQSWPLAWWPDGSLKWTAHALPANAGLASGLRLAAVDKPPATTDTLKLEQRADAIVVDTGVIRCTIPKRGEAVIQSISRNGRDIARNGRLVAIAANTPDTEAANTAQHQYSSTITAVTVEQTGPVRCVIKVDGKHSTTARQWLPFSLRLYLYADAESVRIMHTFVFDGDEQQDFIRGLGVRFDVPLSGALYDRHVRFAGEHPGLWAEAVQGLTGLRRDPGAAFREAQVAGLPCPPLAQMATRVSSALHLVPAWGDYTLSQLSADGFQIRKRTKPGHGWIDADAGKRAAGSGYIGGSGGGVAFGLRDFWQRHPTRLDIRNAQTDSAEVTLWMWSPDAPAMDLRFYHDGMGMETHEQELQGLDITYEDYEKGYGTPNGVARSSEITLWALAATPSRERMVQIAAAVQTPPQLVASPAHLLASGVFGRLWSLPDRSTPAKTAIEDELDRRFDFYKGQVEQRHWYGFWNYGDIMHTYDADRHVWRYDVGGYAWDNSELSPDLWLWYSFLRSGRADIFRLAEAMVRHTSEVDIYHSGRFAGLGSRHNVQHWGCSAKQLRISAAVYRRFYYFLTADERIGDIMRELLDADAKLEATDPVRKIANAPPKGQYPARASFGTDWGSLAGNWLTEWERGGNQRYRDKLLTGMRDIAAMPHGFFNADRAGYEQDSGHLHNMTGDKVAASHLNSVFGAVEVFAELIDITGQQDFEKAWIQYCTLFNADKAAQIRALGMPHGGSTVLRVGHSRLTAYAAARTKDAALARRAWGEFFEHPLKPLRPIAVNGPAVLNPIQEVDWISTNDTAQWGLAAIQNLALIGDYLPEAK
ncbi:Tat pathway signal sequence domain protein [Duganella sp. FT80W]|uniref:Tat pathway signal sequence domain protein n=1 Tax=Duganella guangzhouensis TaxID=2666084 RepID=A0A6I2L128_9BURK|nr:Tat pathway signal sequence domain protein [Duganella guangzhouensis]MRW91430.1 Tat pathway signal sequence domain protein [Duganella guangzhouensis]